MKAFLSERPGRVGSTSNRAWLTVWALASATTAFGQSQMERVTVVGPQGREAIPISELANVPMVPLDELNRFLGSTIQANADSTSATFSVGERSAVVSAGRSMVRIGTDGKLVLLSAPIAARGGRWFVPLDFLDKVLPQIATQRVTYESDTRLLAIGEGFPRISISSFPYPGYTRVVLESSSPIEYQVTQGGGRVHVSMPVSYLESDFSSEELQDGVVDQIKLSREPDGYLLAITLGESYGTLKAFQLESPSRMVLDLFRSRVPTDVEVPPVVPPGSLGQDATADRTPDIPVPPRPTPPPGAVPTDDMAQGILKTITLDPGHGGSETGATGRGGLQEKDVTLEIVRRLAQLLESRLGVRVLLTRDGDNYLELDERTTIANNNKSDLFLSIHANASPGRNASGSEVYYLSYEASDDDAGRVAASENVSGSARPRATSDLDFILWDMAQASHLNESARLAELLQDELQAGRSEDRNRGIKQAPFRVLMGATMPAALIEVGFITNPDEERRLGSSDYQDQLANAIYRAVVKYKDRFDRQARLGGQRSGERD
jgi:N-acetylmuramoyl-L-alanine amidase